MRIVVSNSAFADLESLREYYLAQGVPNIGDNFVTAIIARIQRLVDHPEMGRVVPEFAQPHIREIIHAPFRIVYLREKNHVQIIRIWRSERLLVLPTDET